MWNFEKVLLNESNRLEGLLRRLAPFPQKEVPVWLFVASLQGKQEVFE